MSWSIDVAGTKSGVAKRVTEQLDKVAKGYEGKEEEKDVLAAKERILGIVEAMDLGSDGFGDYAVYVKANGSHASTSKGLLAATLQITIGRTSLALD